NAAVMEMNAKAILVMISSPFTPFDHQHDEWLKPGVRSITPRWNRAGGRNVSGLKVSTMDAAIRSRGDGLLRLFESGELAFGHDSNGRRRRAAFEREAVRGVLESSGPSAVDVLSALADVVTIPGFLARVFCEPWGSQHRSAGRRFRAARALGLSGEPDVA